MRKRKNLRKKLTKSSSNRVIAGVLGGFGEYLNVKPNTLRIIYLIITALTSFIPGIVIYLMLAVLMPDDPHRATPWRNLFNSLNQAHQHQSEQTRKELHDVEETDIKKE